MENLLDVAKYIYDNISSWSDKKIQKITYYAYSWYIIKNNTSGEKILKRLINEHPEAWIHGPVFYDLYKEMTYSRESFFNREANIKDSTKNFLDKIIYVYDRFTGNQLEDMTHNETPWKEARNGLLPNERSREPLKDEVIFSYFNS